jgi:hypothetical protein
MKPTGPVEIRPAPGSILSPKPTIRVRLDRRAHHKRRRRGPGAVRDKEAGAAKEAFADAERPGARPLLTLC